MSNNSIFAKHATTGVEAVKDTVIGSGGILPTGVYQAVVKLMYAITSTNGATGLSCVFFIPSTGKEHREIIYITNRDGENFFIDKKTGKKNLLPGYTTIDDICLLGSGIPLNEQMTENKVVKVYDFESSSEVNKAVPVLVDMLNKELILCIVHLLENKKTKNAQGDYEHTPEERNSNFVEKALDVDSNRTTNEIRAEVTTPLFHDAWLNKHRELVRDRRVYKNGVAIPTQKVITSKPPTVIAPTKSLFAKK